MRYQPSPSGFIYTDKNRELIFGAGATAEEAWAAVVEGVGTFLNRDGEEIPASQAREEQYLEIPATAALLSRISERGGRDLSWRATGPSAYPDLAMTPEEEDARDKDLVLVRSDQGDGGWSLHAPDADDEDIANGDAPALVSGESEPDGDGWARPNSDDYRAAWAAYLTV